MIDDKKKNLTDAELKAVELSIPFTGIRYSKLDPEIQRFNSDPKMQELVVETSHYPAEQKIIERSDLNER